MFRFSQRGEKKKGETPNFRAISPSYLFFPQSISHEVHKKGKKFLDPNFWAFSFSTIICLFRPMDPPPGTQGRRKGGVGGREGVCPGGGAFFRVGGVWAPGGGGGFPWGGVKNYSGGGV